ncbi:hypothetical protein E2C01_044891 [Portunus trituberculatus]|uniref:Uncharacterized protein n=1 Tax=Portunus trituberculatus TaxID=210409 RepID=A0A5B7G3K1_PORTR|nr:hypothetical protein [Portunus trituberculatus]
MDDRVATKAGAAQRFSGGPQVKNKSSDTRVTPRTRGYVNVDVFPAKHTPPPHPRRFTLNEFAIDLSVSIFPVANRKSC